MSLELAIQENTAAVRQLIAVLQSGAVLPAATEAAADAAQESTGPNAKRGRGRAAKAETPASDATAQAGAVPQQTVAPSASDAAAPASILGTVNDSGATRYIHIAKHRTVAAIEAGQAFPSIEGLVEINADLYAKLKAEYTPSVAQAPAPAPTPAAASTQASTPAAQTASSQSPASSAATGGPAVMQKAQALHKAQGNDGLKQVLDHFKVGKVSEIVANGALHAEAIAFMDNLLNPKVEEANLFG